MSCSYRIAEKKAHIFPHQLIDARMYVLIEDNHALVIDPNATSEALAFFAEHKTEDCLILLTHEHYDHISGINELRKICCCRVLCSKTCAERICDPRRNAAAHFSIQFLFHTNQERALVEQLVDNDYACTADETFCGAIDLSWQGVRIHIDELPGHSKGGQIVILDDWAVFSGDTLIPGRQTVTRLPGGDRRAFESIALPYLYALPKDSVIFPGHGDPAPLAEEWTRVGLSEFM